MNKIYKTKWNKSLNAFVAVSELETNRGKSSSSSLTDQRTGSSSSARRFFKMTLLTAVLSSVSLPALAANLNEIRVYDAGDTVIDGGSGKVSNTTVNPSYTLTDNRTDTTIALGENPLGSEGNEYRRGANTYRPGTNGYEPSADGLKLIFPTKHAIAIGGSAKSYGIGATALGYAANAVDKGNVAIGSYSGSNMSTANHGDEAVYFTGGSGKKYKFAGAPTATSKVMSIGAGAKVLETEPTWLYWDRKEQKYVDSPNQNTMVVDKVHTSSDYITRQLQNVSAGRIAMDSTDAINGSQLYAVGKDLQDQIDNLNPGSGGEAGPVPEVIAGTKTTVNSINPEDGEQQGIQYRVNAQTATVTLADNSGLTLDNSGTNEFEGTNFELGLDEQAKAGIDKANNGGITFAGNNGQTQPIKLGDTLNLKGSDGNIIATGNDDGINLALGDTVKIGANQPVTIDGNQGTISSLTNTTWTPNDKDQEGYDKSQAASQGQLDAVYKYAKNAEVTAGEGWNYTAQSNADSKTNVAPSGTVDFAGLDAAGNASANANIQVSKTADGLGFSLNKDLDGINTVNVGEKGEPGVDGQDGKDGVDGTIGVNGQDGSAVVLNGKDGSIGLNGQDGKDGLSIKGAQGPAGVDGKDGENKTRLVYQPATEGAEPETVATLNDGLKFAGDDGQVIAKKLNEQLDIVGGAEGNLTDGNIGVVADQDGRLNVKLADNIDLGDAGSIQFGNQGPKIAQNGIDAGNTRITNVAPAEEGT
ncbi:ESPR domain-containing protein, partial [Brackiella oedipodis]|uniref:ESPR domain-containing protein n=1 Tax=Brackiella oedipodis TaxID=124225 RepID=UPI000571ADF4